MSKEKHDYAQKALHDWTQGLIADEDIKELLSDPELREHYLPEFNHLNDEIDQLYAQDLGPL